MLIWSFCALVTGQHVEEEGEEEDILIASLSLPSPFHSIVNGKTKGGREESGDDSVDSHHSNRRPFAF